MSFSSLKSDIGPERKDEEGKQETLPTSVREGSVLKEARGDPTVQRNNHEPHLNLPLQSAFVRSSDTLSDLSTYSADNENERRTGHLPTVSSSVPLLPASPAPSPRTWKEPIRLFWTKYKGLTLVILSQFFGVMMNVTIRLLEASGASGPEMHPFQILFARMTGTLILSSIYLWWAQVDGAPFGSREVRGLLIARGVGGFFGGKSGIPIRGVVRQRLTTSQYTAFTIIKDSLKYLPLSDATVITFLAPIVASWACSFLLHEPFARNEQIAGIISFLGVVLIAQPTSLLAHHSQSVPPVASEADDAIPLTNLATPSTGHHLQGPDPVTSAQRLRAVGVALIGVLGAASAYTTIRWIGKRAHPLISVNYFAVWTTLVSTVALIAVPGVDFQLPANARQWVYLVFLGICGFVMQFLLTAGLQHEKGSRATNMVYTQMLFALAFDKMVWNTTPGGWAIAGSSLILGSALYVALRKNHLDDKKEKKIHGQDRGDEEAALVVNDTDDDDDDDNVINNESAVNTGTGPLRGVQEVQLRTIRV